MKQLKILVVDDEDRMRKLVRDFLVRKQYEVVEASNGEEAVDVFVESNDIDLIILDVMMPKMDGFEVCKTIRNKVDGKPAGRLERFLRFQLLC